jgi:integrase
MKRGHGEGSIYRRANGSWRAQVTLQGKRLSFTAKTRKECLAWQRQMIEQIEQGLTLEAAKTSFGKVLDTWLSVKETKLRLATQEQYRRLASKYIKPYLGEFIPKDLNAAVIQNFYAELEKQGVGKRTIEVCHVVLHGCLKHAQRLGLIVQNWSELTEVPRPEKREMHVWNENQVNQFLMHAPDPVFYRLAFATGMRRGELIGLKTEDIDWSAEVIQVRRQVYHPEGGGWRFQEPKSRRGRRAIRLGPSLLEALRYQCMHELPLAREIADERWQEYDLLFPSRVGTPRNGSDVLKWFKKHVEAAGLPPLRFHDIRHTAASIMLSHNEPPVRVAAILGQSVSVLLNTYAHFIPSGDESAALLMDEITTPVAIDIAPDLHPENIGGGRENG